MASTDSGSQDRGDHSDEPDPGISGGHVVNASPEQNFAPAGLTTSTIPAHGAAVAITIPAFASQR
jgi:hypothetical protein